MELGNLNLIDIDAVGSLSDPPIFFATLISSGVLACLTIKWLLIWFRRLASNDPAGKTVWISLLCAIYIGIGWFQIWFASALHKDYYNLSPAVNLGLWVPVIPVWLLGMGSGALFLVYRSVRKWKQSTPDRS
jgi:hypothetical protein